MDVFAKLVYGGQVAFEVGFSVTAIGMVIGGLIGLAAGYFGGWTDTILSRLIDVLIAFPALVLALAVAEVLAAERDSPDLGAHGVQRAGVRPGHPGIHAGGQRAAVHPAARLSGTRNWRIILKHVLPNVIPGIVSFSMIGVGIVVILEGALDFLGLGIQQPKPSWGGMIAKGQTVLTAQPEYVLIPSIVLLIFVMALNLLGDALRERWGVR